MRLEKLDLNLLVVMESLIDTQSVSRTAYELNVSQPTVSAALKRLRDYFDDELFVPVGRSMIPTPKSDELASAISELLNLARFRIVRSVSFDPKESSRRFKIIASDYMFDVILAETLTNINQVAPNLEFDILPVSPEMVAKFDKGKVDLLITVENFILAGHPSQKLFSDDDVVICCGKGKYADGVSEQEFSDASFAAAAFGVERRSAVSEMHFEAMGLKRRIAMHVSAFSGLPAAVVGTNHLAVMHRKHAKFFEPKYPIAVHDLPAVPHQFSQIAQWHRLREKDAGIHWFLRQIESTIKANWT